MRIRAGKLNKYVDLQVNTPSQDAMGGAGESWASHMFIWASIRGESAKEAINSDKFDQTVTYIIHTRPIDIDITPSMRIVYDSRTFNIIKAVNAQERDIMVEITAVEDLNA